MKKTFLTLAIISAFANAEGYLTKVPVEVQNAVKVIDEARAEYKLKYCSEMPSIILKELEHAESFLKYKSYKSAKTDANLAKEISTNIVVECEVRYPESAKAADEMIKRADKILEETKDVDVYKIGDKVTNFLKSHLQKHSEEWKNAGKVTDKEYDKKGIFYCNWALVHTEREVRYSEVHLKYKIYSDARISAEFTREWAVDVAVFCAEKYPESVKLAEAIISRADKVLAETKDKK